MIPSMRAGLGGANEPIDAARAELIETVAALMRVFMREAITVAGRYTIGAGRRRVRAIDMRAALMYCARMFFQEQSDEGLRASVERERALMLEESSSDEETDEDGEDLADADTPSEAEESSEGASDEEEGDDDVEEAATEQDRGLVRRVDAIVSGWEHWHPTDPVQCMIRRAIDNTPA